MGKAALGYVFTALKTVMENVNLLKSYFDEYPKRVKQNQDDLEQDISDLELLSSTTLSRSDLKIKTADLIDQMNESFHNDIKSIYERVLQWATLAKQAFSCWKTIGQLDFDIISEKVEDLHKHYLKVQMKNLELIDVEMAKNNYEVLHTNKYLRTKHLRTSQELLCAQRYDPKLGNAAVQQFSDICSGAYKNMTALICGKSGYPELDVKLRIVEEDLMKHYKVKDRFKACMEYAHCKDNEENCEDKNFKPVLRDPPNEEKKTNDKCSKHADTVYDNDTGKCVSVNTNYKSVCLNNDITADRMYTNDCVDIDTGECSLKKFSKTKERNYTSCTEPKIMISYVITSWNGRQETRLKLIAATDLMTLR